VDCVNILYICIYYTRVADYVTVRVVQHQVTRLQGLTYGSTSFKLGDATGSTNRRLYATTGTITSPLVKTCPTGHYLVPTGDLRLQLDESVMLFICLLTACCTSTNSGDDESAVAVSRTGAVCLSVWRQRGVCKRRCAGMATCLTAASDEVYYAALLIITASSSVKNEILF